MFYPKKIFKLLNVHVHDGVLHGSVVKCLAGNPGVRGMSSTGSSGFFMEVSLGKTLQSPSLVHVLMKPRMDLNNVRCSLHMTEILLKKVKHHSINQLINHSITQSINQSCLWHNYNWFDFLIFYIQIFILHIDQWALITPKNSPQANRVWWWLYMVRSQWVLSFSWQYFSVNLKNRNYDWKGYIHLESHACVNFSSIDTRILFYPTWLLITWTIFKVWKEGQRTYGWCPFQDQVRVVTCIINSFPNDRFWTLPNWKRLQMTISGLMKMADSSPNW